MHDLLKPLWRGPLEERLRGAAGQSGCVVAQGRAIKSIRIVDEETLHIGDEYLSTRFRADPPPHPMVAVLVMCSVKAQVGSPSEIRYPA